MTKPRRWLLPTLSLASLTSGCALLLLLVVASPIAGMLNRQYRIDDDWAWLAFPIGGAWGFWLGLRYRRRVWTHVASALLGVCQTALAVYCLWVAVRKPRDLGEGIGKLIAEWMLHVILWVVAVALVLAGAAVLILRQRRPLLERRKKSIR